MRLFDAHAHLQNYPGRTELDDAFARASASGVRLTLCNGTRPEDWESVLLVASGREGVLPFLGLHPWFAEKAGAGWLELLERSLLRLPSGIGEIGLDKVSDQDFVRQEEVFRAQLGLARKLGRPAAIHCVKAWGRLTEILKEEKPPAFMLHAYGGPPEMTEELACLGAYFSFGGGLTDPGRKKLRSSLLCAPPERLLFETEAPSQWELTGVLDAAASVLGQTPGSLGELSWNNARTFLGDIFPDL